MRLRSHIAPSVACTHCCLIAPASLFQFRDADTWNPLPDAALQLSRNKLGGRKQRRILKLFFRYVIPSVQRRRQLREWSPAVERFGRMEFYQSCDAKGECMYWNQFDREIARVLAYPNDAVFASEIANRAGVRLPWQPEWPSIACEPHAVELPSEHPAVATAREFIVGAIGDRTEFVWDFDVRRFHVYAVWPRGSYPRCREEQLTFVRVYLTFENGPEAAEYTVAVRSAVHPDGLPNGGRSVKNAFFQEGFDARLAKRKNSQASASSRTMHQGGADFLLHHMNMWPHARGPLGERRGGDTFWDQEELSDSIHLLLEYPNELRIYASEDDDRQRGFEPDIWLETDGTRFATVVTVEGRRTVPTRRPANWLPGNRFSIGCLYAPDDELDVTFEWTNAKQPFIGEEASGKLFTDWTGTVIGGRLNGGAGYLPGSVRSSIEAHPAMAGRGCKVMAQLPEVTTSKAASRFIHANKDCWDSCDQQSGRCEWCGSQGACCRSGWGGSDGCAVESGCIDFHCCTRARAPLHSIVLTSQPASMEIGALHGYSGIEIESPFPICPNFPITKCYYRVNFIRVADEHDYNLDFIYDRMSFVPIEVCDSESCVEYSAAEEEENYGEHPLVDSVGDLKQRGDITGSLAVNSPKYYSPCCGVRRKYHDRSKCGCRSNSGNRCKYGNHSERSPCLNLAGAEGAVAFA